MRNRPAGELSRFHRDVTFYETHKDELLQRYPEQWVAIFNEQVAGTDADYEHLLDVLQARGIPVGRVFIQRATSQDELLILPG